MSCSQLSRRRKFTNPGPATSTLETWVGGAACSRAASASASSRGLRPTALATVKATLVDQSPCSRRAGRSSSTTSGGWTPSPTRAERTASARTSRITNAWASGELAFVEHGVDPLDKVDGVERLGHVVVGAEVEASLHLRRLCLGGQENDGHVLRARVGASCFEHLETVELRHHDVDHDRVGPLLADGAQSLVAVAGGDDREALHLEVDLEQLEDHRVVVD